MTKQFYIFGVLAILLLGSMQVMAGQSTCDVCKSNCCNLGDCYGKCTASLNKGKPTTYDQAIACSTRCHHGSKDPFCPLCEENCCSTGECYSECTKAGTPQGKPISLPVAQDCYQKCTQN